MKHIEWTYSLECKLFSVLIYSIRFRFRNQYISALRPHSCHDQIIAQILTSWYSDGSFEFLRSDRCIGQCIVVDGLWKIFQIVQEKEECFEFVDCYSYKKMGTFSKNLKLVQFNANQTRAQNSKQKSLESKKSNKFD